MLQLSFILVFVLGLTMGWFQRTLWERCRRLTRVVLALVDRQVPPEPPPEGKVIEPSDDPIAAARAEFEARSRKLNP